MRVPFFLTLAVLGLTLLAGCDTTEVDPPPPDTFPFNPDTLDFDAIASLDYGDYVQPLLAFRDALGDSAVDPTTTPSSRLSAYAWSALFEGDTAWGETVIPFDGTESLMIKLIEALPDGVEIPYPNLRTLEDDEVRYLKRWIEAGARSDQGTVPFADAQALVYVCNQLANRVAVLDADRRQVIRYVYFDALGEGTDAKPHHTAVEPDGSAWYVSLITGTDGGSILKLNTDLDLDPADPAYLLARETPPDGEPTFQKPGMLWLDASSQYLFAGRSFSATGSQNVARLDRRTMALEEFALPQTDHPHAIATSQDGQYLLSASLANTPPTMTVLDAETGDFVDQEAVEGENLAFVHYGISPDGFTAVLTSQTSAELFFLTLDAATGTLDIDERTTVGMQPWHPVYAPDGSRVYVPNRASHTVSVVDASTKGVIDTYANPSGGEVLFSEPHGSGITADGRYLFIANRNTQQIPDAPVRQPPYPFQDGEGNAIPATHYGFVDVIDTQSGEVVASIPMGQWASGMAVYDPR